MYKEMIALAGIQRLFWVDPGEQFLGSLWPLWIPGSRRDVTNCSTQVSAPDNNFGFEALSRIPAQTRNGWSREN
jgi:hypothetical protein